MTTSFRRTTARMSSRQPRTPAWTWASTLARTSYLWTKEVSLFNVIVSHQKLLKTLYSMAENNPKRKSMAKKVNKLIKLLPKG
jgi:hypothetical protein